MKIIVENTVSRFEDVSTVGNKDLILAEVDAAMAVRQKNYFFSQAFKSGRWDGYLRFYKKKDKSFPSGLLHIVTDLLDVNEVEYTIDDRRTVYDFDIPTEIKLMEPDADGGHITLRDYQYDSVVAALQKRRGIVNVATNGGKTEIASGIIQQLLPKLNPGQRILFVTHNKEIFHQSAARLERRLGIKIGKVGDGVWDERPVTIVMVPTITRHVDNKNKPKAIKYTKEFKAIKLFLDLIERTNLTPPEYQAIGEMLQNQPGTTEQDAAEIALNVARNKTTVKKLVKALEKFELKQQKKPDKKQMALNLLKSAVAFIGDEFHHSTSDTWYKTLMLCENAVFRIGLTGTVDKNDEINYLRIISCTGGILTKISNEFLIKKGFSAKPTILLSRVDTPLIPSKTSWQEAYRIGIVENEYRNNLIAKKVAEKAELGKGCLVITNHIKHGDLILKALKEAGVEAEFTNGGRTSEEREAFLKKMKDGELKVLIATSILDEGVDISGINCVWMAAGGKSYRQTLQRVGRGLRKKEDGSGLEVYDFLDYTHHILTKHTSERFAYYKAEGFEIIRDK